MNSQLHPQVHMGLSFGRVLTSERVAALVLEACKGRFRNGQFGRIEVRHAEESAGYFLGMRGGRQGNDLRIQPSLEKAAFLPGDTHQRVMICSFPWQGFTSVEYAEYEELGSPVPVPSFEWVDAVVRQFLHNMKKILPRLDSLPAFDWSAYTQVIR